MIPRGTTIRTFVLYDAAARDRLIDALHKVPLDPVRPWTFKLVPFVEPPTTKQKGYYRGVIVPTLAAHTGYTENEMHVEIMRRFEKYAATAVDLFLLELEEFEARASKAVMSEVIERTLRWAAIDLDCYIPPPERQR